MIQLVDERFPNGSLPRCAASFTRPLPAMTATEAAVCILFVPPQSSQPHAELVLTRRSLEVRGHRGQVSLAGGVREPHEQDPKETALRELEEELGIERSSCKFQGYVAPTQVLSGSNPKGRNVGAIIATTDTCPSNFILEESEVSKIYCTPWPSLTRRCNQRFGFTVFGERRMSHYFKLKECGVWGMTARLLYEADFQ